MTNEVKGQKILQNNVFLAQLLLLGGGNIINYHKNVATKSFRQPVKPSK